MEVLKLFCIISNIHQLLWILLFPIASSIRHESNLIWAQTPSYRLSVARLVGIEGDPHTWIPLKKPNVKHISAPQLGWEFKALGFIYRRQQLIWSESMNKKIQALVLNGSTETIDIYTGTSSEVYGLAVDWLSGNVYWADALYNWIVMAPIRPVSPSIQVYRIILQEELDNPHGLAVYPSKGYLFVSDWGIRPRIDVCNLLGDNRRILVDDKLQHPRGLTLDYSFNRLYWVDSGLDTVESILLNGQDRKLHWQETDSNFFGIAIFENYFFITEQSQGQLKVYNSKATNSTVSFSLGNIPYSIVMYDESLQTGNTSACESEGCAHICVDDPLTGPKCLCGNGYNTTDDGKTCNESNKFAHPSHLYAIGVSICHYPANMPDMSLENVTLTSQCFLTERFGYLALTFDARANMLYYSANYTNTISYVLLEYGAKPKIIAGGTGVVKGLALDWVAGNLFWTDSTNAYIKVSRKDGAFQRVLIKEDINSPLGIAVHPKRGKIYWTDIGILPDVLPKIESANMDGSERTLIMGDNLGQPNHIIVDYNTDNLYWADSVLNHVRQFNLDTRKVTVLYSQPSVRFYGISLFKDLLLWTDTDDMNGIHAARLDKQRKVRGIIHPNYGQAADIITFDVTLQPNLPSSCAEDSTRCQQLCLQGSNGSFWCQCGLGYRLVDNRYSCMSELVRDNFILVNDAFQKQIYQVDTKNGVILALGLETDHQPIALDYDPLTQHVYWSDNTAHVLARRALYAKQSEIILKLPENSVSDGIAVDYINNLLFYTDTGRDLIGVINLLGIEGHRTLISTGSSTEPRGIVVNPIEGKIYWSDWGLDSKIMTANMDGTAQRVLVKFNSTAWPNGLALDIKGQALYWADAYSNSIIMYDLAKDSYRTMITEEAAHYFDLFVMGDFLYVTDWRRNYIARMHKQGGQLMQFGESDLTKLYGISGFNSSELIRAESACRKTFCEHLCVPLPLNQTRCLCFDGYIMDHHNICILAPSTASTSQTTTPGNSTTTASANTSPGAKTSGIKFADGSKQTQTATRILASSDTSNTDQFIINPSTSAPVESSEETTRLGSDELEPGTKNYTDDQGQVLVGHSKIQAGPSRDTIIVAVVVPVLMLLVVVIIGVAMYRKRRTYFVPHAKLVEDKEVNSNTFPKVIYPRNGDNIAIDSGIENPTYDCSQSMLSSVNDD